MWRPLLRFVLLGGLLFAADRWLLREPPRQAPVRVSAERFAQLQQEALRLGGRPSDEALAALVQAEVDDELLYRRARALGYDRNDPVVAQRLVQNLRFAGADPERDDASLYAEALKLGLDQSDPVVRRRLVERMRFELATSAQGPEPSDDELRARYAKDAARFALPARTRFAQLYFARGHEAAARAALAELRAKQVPPADAGGRGEPFLHPSLQPPLSDDELAARFGRELADALRALPVGSWQGPVPSAYGQHLVYVEERLPAGQAPLESVREPLRLGVLAERGARALEAELARMRQGVQVVIEGATTPAGSRAGG